MIEEDIAELKQQVLSLQTVLSLVLSPEHRKVINSDDLRRTLKDLLKEDEASVLAQKMQAQSQQRLQMEANARARADGLNRTTSTGMIGGPINNNKKWP